MACFRGLRSLNRDLTEHHIEFDLIYKTADINKRHISNQSKDPKPGLSIGEMRVSSLNGTLIESEYVGEQRTLRLSCGGTG